MTDMQLVTVTVDDVRSSGYCGPGLAAWMAEKGFDLRSFIKFGMPADRMVATGDAYALRAVEAAVKRYENGK